MKLTNAGLWKMNIILILIGGSIVVAAHSKNNPDGNPGSSVSSIFHSSRDTTLAGFDVALSLDAFKAKYSDKIQDCHSDSFTDDQFAPGMSVPITVCTLKSGNGEARFYNGTIYRFYSDATKDDVKLRLAAEELEKKSGNSFKMATFTGGIGNVFCAASVPFYNGEASVTSNNIFGALIVDNQRTGETDNINCTDAVFSDSTWASIIYDDKTAKDSMATALVNERDKAERKTAGDVSF